MIHTVRIRYTVYDHHHCINSSLSVQSGSFVGRIVNVNFANTTTAAGALAGPAQAVSPSAASQDFADLDSKIFVDKLGSVLPILKQFFCIMAWNGTCNGMHLHAGYTLKRYTLARVFWSISPPSISSLCAVGSTFAFSGRYNINAKMFFAHWTVTWVYI
ncbi:hypothetical protein T440DRAFT_557726 [Plenodomus tracheiphilus IPT5]|uniref:DUF3533 domain-containing protein n=1 Tax=Plenodomus tracheiphilus IPT5 TaxID=1408161 RepID=A0A6A7AVB3_9PLEO|nr:hypothetical protein T440DRAFT_557726 [Plenodomus tracheiphilus IPT5]